MDTVSWLAYWVRVLGTPELAFGTFTKRNTMIGLDTIIHAQMEVRRLQRERSEVKHKGKTRVRGE